MIESSPLAGKTVNVMRGQFKGESFTIEDFACNVFGRNDWFMNLGNPTVVEYLATHTHYPGVETSVLYGKIGMFAHILDPTELRVEGEGDAKRYENLLWELVGALDVSMAFDTSKKPIVAEYARCIADELGSGTCYLCYGYDDDGYDGWYCDKCGGWFQAVWRDGTLVEPKHCQECGKAVE